MSKEKNHVFIVAIVAIVAVAGLVLFSQRQSDSADESVFLGDWGDELTGFAAATNKATTITCTSPELKSPMIIQLSPGKKVKPVKIKATTPAEPVPEILESSTVAPETTAPSTGAAGSRGATTSVVAESAAATTTTPR